MEDRKTPLQMLYASGSLSAISSGHMKCDGAEEKRARRNTREQKRAAKINEQIEMLKQLLQDAGYPMKSTSKYHVLYGCEKYMKELAEKSKMSKRMKKAENYRNETSSDYDSNSSDSMTETMSSKDEQVSETSQQTVVKPQPKQESFEGVFCTSEVPIAVASADGQILRSNEKFCAMTGYTSEELRSLTIFALAHPQFRKQMFEAVGASIVSVLSSKEVSVCPRIVPVQVRFLHLRLQLSSGSACRLHSFLRMDD
jgi:PAS domain-containing protein